MDYYEDKPRNEVKRYDRDRQIVLNGKIEDIKHSNRTLNLKNVKIVYSSKIPTHTTKYGFAWGVYGDISCISKYGGIVKTSIHASSNKYYGLKNLSEAKEEAREIFYARCHNFYMEKRYGIFGYDHNKGELFSKEGNFTVTNYHEQFIQYKSI